VIVKKGRRFGLTRGAANHFVKTMVVNDGITMLWGDTVHGNIRRYFERYFLPSLKQLPPKKYEYSLVDKILKVGNSVCDFRSADNPENWEGFGYDEIFLNEGGIILKDNYLYDNAVLPMLLDNPNSRLIVGGVPKGKTFKGEEHKFYELWKRCENKEIGYKGYSFTSYDSVFVNADDLDELKRTLPPMVFRQEILAEFLDFGKGTVFNKGVIVDTVPNNLKIYIGSDLAYSKSTSSDYSVIVVIGVCPLGNIYILHVERWQSEIGGTIERLKAIQNEYKVNISVEANGVQKAVADMVAKSDVRITRVNPSSDKLTRSLPFAMKWNGGKVFVKSAGWTLDYCNELEEFSGDGEGNDDQVDASVYAHSQLNKSSLIEML
jgi:predicted phage terminase large subunit-like protein